jgi:hypothetical protein
MSATHRRRKRINASTRPSAALETNATGQVTLDLPSGINPSQLVVEDVGSGTDVVLAR